MLEEAQLKGRVLGDTKGNYGNRPRGYIRIATIGIAPGIFLALRPSPPFYPSFSFHHRISLHSKLIFSPDLVHKNTLVPSTTFTTSDQCGVYRK